MKVCGQPGCAELTGSTYCPEHTPKPWATSRRAERIGKSGWEQQKDRRRILRAHNRLCHWCQHGDADQVDHVIELADGGADDPTNKLPIHSRCSHCGRRCHAEKTAAAQRARRPPGG